MNLTAWLPAAFALALLNPTHGQHLTTAQTSDRPDTMAVLPRAVAHAGTYEDPKSREEHSDKIETVYAIYDSEGVRRLYSSKFVGYPADQPELPLLPDGYQDVSPTTPSVIIANDAWLYRGTHAGTYADPQIPCGATYAGAIHRIELRSAHSNEKTYAFFKEITSTGDNFDAVSCWVPVPTTAASDNGWTYLESTSHLGTLSDPKGDETVADFTWEGAIHVFRMDHEIEAYYASKQEGTVSNAWTRPDPTCRDDTEHWAFVGNRMKATYQHPAQGLGSGGLTWIGAVYSFPVDGKPTYFVSRFEGLEATVNPAVPETAASNEFFSYVGLIDETLGTQANPKGLNDPTWPGQIHAFDLPERKVYYEAHFEGLPSDRYPSVEDVQADPVNWAYKGESRHVGTYEDPKTLEDLTWPGAIHKRDGYFDGSSIVSLYYESTFSGTPAVLGIDYPQDGLHSDKQWIFRGGALRAGTFQSPKDEIEVTWKGAIHASYATADEPRHFFISQVEGNAPAGSRPFPARAQNSDAWTYMGTDDHAGTFVDPKTEHDFTWPGAIHLVDEKARLRYFSSTFYGTPPLDQGWEYPKGKFSNKSWTYLVTSRHRGTYADPKTWEDMTWPGAIHDQYADAGHLYFMARDHGVPSKEGWTYPTDAVDNEHWFFARREKSKGTFDDPKDSDDVTHVGAIHKIFRSYTATWDFYASRMHGLPEETGARLPQGHFDNEFFTYIGESRHDGTYTDPKTWDELTWEGLIHRYEYAGTVLYFAAKVSGIPSQQGWLYPTTGTSNNYWAFMQESRHAGTFADPKDWEDITWPGAIHAHLFDGVRRFYAAKAGGVPSDNEWNYPIGGNSDNGYWTYLSTQLHEGTYADPKELNEPTWPGAIHLNQVDASRYYYESRNDGIPSKEGWHYPSGSVSDNNWIYLATGTHQGTPADPNVWGEPTWPGATHVNIDQTGHYFYYTSLNAGIPADNAWHYPGGESDNDHWIYKGTGRHSGEAYDAKELDEFTWPGALHYSTVNNRRVLFASKNEGVPSHNAWHYPLTEHDDANWTFAGQAHAGTFIDPRNWNEPTSPGAKHLILHDNIPYFYTATFTGNAAEHNWYFPTGETTNNYWTYASKHYGTFDDPKTLADSVWAGAISLIDNAGTARYYEARQEGTPMFSGWPLPANGSSNAYWIDRGRHAGTLADPKDWDEPTWPGAIHRYIQPDKTYFYTARAAGVPSEHNWYYPAGTTSNATWTHLADWVQTAPGINDFSRPFNRYTWATAHNAYLNSIKEQLERGIRGFMLDLHPRNHPGGEPYLALCHAQDDNVCIAQNESNNEWVKTLNDVYLPFLKANPSAVITLLLESYADRELLNNELKKVSPELLAMVFNPTLFGKGSWPLLGDMILKNQRVVILADRDESTGTFTVDGIDVTILKNTQAAVENTYDLGGLITHDWACKTRDINHPLNTDQSEDSRGWPLLFVMNQFHAFGSSQAHAGDVDNNLTWLQRRVLDECLSESHKYPNYIAVDYNQTGDALSYAAALSQGGVYLYEKPNADRSGDTVCVLPALNDYNFRLPAHGCENDEVRSVQLAGVARGTRITLYDSPNGIKSDDFVYIDVKKTMPIEFPVTIASLEHSFSDNQVTVTALRNNGMDGKVSRIVVGKTPMDSDFSGAEIVFHENNDATGSTVCTVPFARNDRFKMGAGNNPYGCDNDEIRSATVVRAKKGSYFSLVGNPDGTFNQGKAAVTVMQDITAPRVIPSFNRPYYDGVIRVEVSNGGNLDGKSSYGYFEPLQ
ncbi:hypothetical protein [Pseudomonas syringae]|uniref:hypothetical protein n=1 Tax=Pseudomonas syringae TaxID=317 RepID=UPI001F3883FB|nr:hypothetical protein [Pseudomonas syringae]